VCLLVAKQRPDLIRTLTLEEPPMFQQRINQRLAESIPNAMNIRIPDASHLVHEDNPQAVAVAILAFCQKHDLV
jgi:hypothetical protein